MSGRSNIQTSGSAFLRPVKWYPAGANLKFIANENTCTVEGTIHPVGPSVPATIFGKYCRDGKSLDLAQTFLFVSRTATDASGAQESYQEGDQEGDLHKLGARNGCWADIKPKEVVVAWDGKEDVNKAQSTEEDSTKQFCFTFGKRDT